MTGPRNTSIRGVSREVGWSRLRWAVFAVYLLVIGVIVVRSGVPTGRVQLLTLAIIGVGISVIGRGWRAALQLLTDWIPFAAVLLLYDRSRGIVTSLGVPVHEQDVTHVERWFFDGHIPTVWLQAHLYTPGHVHWYDALCTLVYTTHFVATPALAAVLWVRNRDRWKAFVARVVLVSLAGLVTYAAFPEAPPWMASQHGFIGPVSRLSARGWEYLHLGNVRELLARGQEAGSNPVAAMPSLHTAFTVLVAAALIRQLHGRLRWLLLLYPPAMGFALVYLGEHYVIDIVAGIAYAVAVEYAVGRWERHRRVRREQRADPGPAQPAQMPVAQR